MRVEIVRSGTSEAVAVAVVAVPSVSIYLSLAVGFSQSRIENGN